MVPEGWEWLKGQPLNWEAPERLQVPTGSAALNLAVQMIGSNIIGNDIIEVVAEFISAKARIELWMGHLDPPLTLQRKFAVGRSSSDAVRVAYEAWIEYGKAHQLAGGKVAKIAKEREGLLVAVREATAILVRAQSGESG